MASWPGLLLVSLFWALCTSSAFAAQPIKCEHDSLKHYPMTDALKIRAGPLMWPWDMFAAEGESHNVIGPYILDSNGARKAKEALTRGLMTFKLAERETMMLAAIDAWTRTADGFPSFFVLDQGVYTEEVLATLDAADLPKYAALFRQGRALFGSADLVPGQREKLWRSRDGTVRDFILDARLKLLSKQFQALPRLLQVAEARIESSATLTAIFEPIRASASDENRLDYLADNLWQCLIENQTPAGWQAYFASLPKAYERVLVLYVFEADLLNGSAEQFFYNSYGQFAPEVVEALNHLGLRRHADAVQRGIDLFPNPYPRDLWLRRDFMALKGEELDDRLEALTSVVDDGALRPGMIHLLRDAGRMPE